MGKYRKKPVVIEAMQYIPGETCEALSEWMGYQHGHSDCHPEAVWIIETLEGEMSASPGDWIIKGIKGEFYPCKPDIFETTYDEVES